MRSARRGSVRVERLLVHAPVLHDQPEVLRLLQQSDIGNRITVNFEHCGKVVIDGSQVMLMRVFDT